MRLFMALCVMLVLALVASLAWYAIEPAQLPETESIRKGASPVLAGEPGETVPILEDLYGEDGSLRIDRIPDRKPITPPSKPD